MNIKQTAHNWARKYMTQQNKPARYSLMNEAERRLFLYVRGVNFSMLQKVK